MTSYKDKPFVALLDLRHQYPNGQNQNVTHGLKQQHFSILQMNDVCDQTQKQRQYLLTSSSHSNSTKNDIYEVQNITHSKSSNFSSFFVGSRVISNPSLHLINRVDPLFFLLSYFNIDTNNNNEQSQKWQPWNQICENRNIHHTVRQILQHDKSQLRHFFHINDSLVLSQDDNNDDLILYKFQSDKALKWLNAKIRKVETMLEKQYKARRTYEERIRQTEKDGNNHGAFSSSFVLSKNNCDKQSSDNLNEDSMIDQIHEENKICEEKQSEDTKSKEMDISLSSEEQRQLLKSSIQVVCEYISPSWQSKLLEYLKLDIDVILSTSKSKQEKKETKDNSNPNNHPTVTPALSSSPLFNEGKMSEADKLLQYTMGSGTGTSTNDDSNDKKRKINDAKSVGLKRLQKVNTKGMKSLSSFFGPAAGASKKTK